ncbi:MAG: translocase, partial [Xanthomonadales bacterium]|nr:translocase [Xanthomonadales bacterium]
LYTSLDREVRYKAKAFIDTAVYRFGDLSSAWMVALLSSAGVALAGFALIGIGVATAISRVGFLAGSAHEARVAGIRDKDKQPALVAQPASPPA